jgi:nucleoside-diphosphate-sugar epimerase
MRTRRVYRGALPRRFRAATVLLVGCGDVGRRIGALLAARGLRAVGTVRSEANAAALRAAGIRPLRLDLDAPRARALRAFAARVVHLAPPPAEGAGDPRTARLVAALLRGQRAGPPEAGQRARSRSPAGPTQRWVYVSTTGVYGDCAGGLVPEHRPVAPANPRAARRVAAEVIWKRAAARGQARAVRLRVPGIYGHDRLPLERLRQGLPALRPEDDVHTNHIHADDLARICLAALWRGRSGRVIHTVDDSGLRMGDYFDRVADAAGLPRPPRLPRDELARRVSPMMLSFMRESRRLLNDRLKRELRVSLRYPTVDHTLAEVFPDRLHLRARQDPPV